MKIDVGMPTASQVQLDASVRQTSKTAVSGSQDIVQDRTTLQSDTATVQSLVQQALSLPDVRAAKVDAVRQAVNDGSFKIDTQKIADGIRSEGDL